MTQILLRMQDRVNAIPSRFVLGLSICLAGFAVLLQSFISSLWSAWVRLDPSAAQALEASLFAGAATGIGAMGVLVLRRRPHAQGTFEFLALSAGAMLSAALVSLLVPAVRMTTIPLALDVLLAAGMGYAAMAALDQWLPHMHAAPREQGGWPSDSMRLMVIAIAAHNLPEGFAVGAGFGGGDALGWGTAASIGLQNIPEGLIVATALLSMGMRRTTAFVLAAATGLLEPLGAALGVVAVSISALTLPWALAAAGGAMMCVVVEELIPESLKGASHRSAALSFTAGSAGMAALLTVF